MERRLHTWRARLVLLTLAWTLTVSAARADSISLTTLGDSLTSTYSGHPTRAGDQSWTDLLTSLRSGPITINNVAVSGAGSTDLVTSQLGAASPHLSSGSFATVYIGSNDLYNYFNPPPGMGTSITPAALVGNLLQNIATAVGTLQAANVHVVLATVPDFGATPYVQNLLAGNQPALQAITELTTAVNTGILTLGQDLRIPVVDLFALNNISRGPVMIGGVNVTPDLYAADGFHPSSIGQALLANATLQALTVAYGVNTSSLQFTDAEILGLKGLSPQAATTFDIAPFVVYAQEPGSWALLVLGLVGVFGRRAQKGMSSRSALPAAA
jgi:lysophospholipase L1-like esterase